MSEGDSYDDGAFNIESDNDNDLFGKSNVTFLETLADSPFYPVPKSKNYRYPDELRAWDNFRANLRNKSGLNNYTRDRKPKKFYFNMDQMVLEKPNYNQNSQLSGKVRDITIENLMKCTDPDYIEQCKKLFPQENQSDHDLEKNSNKSSDIISPKIEDSNHINSEPGIDKTTNDFMNQFKQALKSKMNPNNNGFSDDDESLEDN